MFVLLIQYLYNKFCKKEEPVVEPKKEERPSDPLLLRNYDEEKKQLKYMQDLRAAYTGGFEEGQAQKKQPDKSVQAHACNECGKEATHFMMIKGSAIDIVGGTKCNAHIATVLQESIPSASPHKVGVPKAYMWLECSCSMGANHYIYNTSMSPNPSQIRQDGWGR